MGSFTSIISAIEAFGNIKRLIEGIVFEELHFFASIFSSIAIIGKLQILSICRWTLS